MEVKKIDLNLYKNPRATFFTGRPQGEMVREKLDLDNLDKEKGSRIIFTITGEVSSFNPSFYLGLLYPSYKNLTLEGFDKKYSFEILSDNTETVRLLEKDLEDGRRSAINSLQSKASIFDFFKK